MAQYVTIVVKSQWYTPLVNTQIKSALAGALDKSIKLWYDTLKQKLNVWGSVPVASKSGNMRERKVHSRVGEPPRKQTSNLYESIRSYVNVNDLSGGVYTDVDYAPSLEYGGIAYSFFQLLKKYTRIRLINPLHGHFIIGPRPAWRQTFNECMPQVEQIYASALPGYSISSHVGKP